MLRLQRFQQGTLNVDEYFKELETLVLKIELEESEEAMIARFVSGLRKIFKILLSYKSIHHWVL